MSNFAKNKNGEIVYAEDFKFNINDKFYCVNESCNAELSMVALDSVNVKTHFRAVGNNKHNILCPYAKTSTNNKVDYSNFDLKKFYENILNINAESNKENKNAESTKKSLHNTNSISINNSKSIKTLYNHLITLKPDDYIMNDVKVKDFLVDKNTYDYYNNKNVNIKGIKIIECAFAKFHYKKEKIEYIIHCSYNFGFDKNHKPKIKLDFSNNMDSIKLYFDYMDKIKKIRLDNNLENSVKSYPILIVFGEVDDDLTIKIKNKKQVRIL